MARLASVSPVVRLAIVSLFAVANVRCGGDETVNNYFYGGDGSPNGGGDGSPGGDGGPSPGTPRVEDCTPDPARVAAREACRADDQCPCGTACDAGQCVAACTAAEQCAVGERCDTFGRCRPSADLRTIAALSASASGVLSASPPFIEAAGVLDTLVVARADDNDIFDVRVEAGPGLEINCDEVTTFGPSCVLPYLPAGNDRVFQLRTTSAIAPDEVRTVELFAGSQVATISVVQARPVLTDAPVPQPSISRPVGSYVGRARIRDVGSRISLATAVPTPAVSGSAPSRVFDVPITAELYANPSPDSVVGYYTLVLHDVSQTLLPTGELIGVFKGQSPVGFFNVDFHAEPWVTTIFESAARPLGYEPEFNDVRVRYRFQVLDDAATLFGGPPVAGIAVDDANAGRISFDMLAHYDVGERHQTAPKTRWHVSLTFAGDLPPGATRPFEPAESAIDILGLRAERYLVPSLWEARVASSFGTADPRAIARTWLRRDANLGACKLASTGLDATRLPDANFGISSEAAAAGQLYNQFWLNDNAATAAATSPSVLSTSRQDVPLSGGTLHPMLVDMAQAADVISPGTPADVSYADNATVPWSIVSVTTPFAAVNPALRAREVPCALTAEPGTLENVGNAGSVVIGSTVYDRCDELADIVACDVRDLAVGEQTNVVHFFTNGFIINRLGTASTIRFANIRDGGSDRRLTVTRVCRMPSTPMVCAEVAACHGGGATPQSGLLINDFRTNSGDALCDSGNHVFGLDADVNGAGLTAIEMLATCLDDGARLLTPPASGAPIEAALASNGCASIGGLLFAMGAASDSLRESALVAVGEQRLERASQLSHRLLVRFADLFGFIARESAEAEKFGQVVRREGLAAAGIVPTPREALSASLRGWNALLDPRFTVAMRRLNDNTILSPEYREFYGEVPANAPTGPNDPLAVALLRTITAQVELALIVVERAQIARDVSAFASAAETLRYALVVEVLAHDLFDRALAACNQPGGCNGRLEPAWAGRYRAAEAAFVTARERLQGAMDILRTGENPLGITEADLPLYFTGGQISDDGRYFAISDYLIGTSPGSQSNWAPSLVEDAQHKLEVARAAWLEREERVVGNSRDASERAARLDDVATTYGDRVAELCGRPGDALTSELLTQWSSEHGSEFNPNDCFIRQDDPACSIDFTAYAFAVTPGDVQKSACVLQEIDREAPGQARFIGADFTAAALVCPAEQAAVPFCAGGIPCFRCGGGVDVPIPPGMFLSIQVDGNVAPATVAQAKDVCTARFPDAPAAPPSFASLGTRPPNACFRGAIGEQQVAVASIGKDVEIARAELDGFRASYDIAMQSCIRRNQADNLKASMQAAHDRQMKTLRTVKLVADIAANAAGAVKDCAGQVAGATAPWDKGAAAVGCGAAAVEAVAKSVSDGMQFAMDNAEDEHERALDSVDAQASYDICRNDAQQYLVGVRAQGLRIQRAMLDLEAAGIALGNLKAEAQRAWDDGQATLASETNRTLTPLDTDLWLDERVDAFVSSMRLAKRVTYLAVRAVEYEYQQSLVARATVLRAELPADLEDALRELRTYTGPRTVRGSKPTNKKAVVSLRDAILRVSDQTGLPVDDHRLTPNERLQLALTSPKHAVFGPGGEYLGQQVPFTVSPIGFASEAVSLEIYAQDACAEKLWSVNASLLGTDLLRGSGATFTNLTVLKANTFFSQWCDPLDRETVMQAASVRPERNLFRDPVAGSPDFIDAQLAGADSRFSKALIQPSLNVPREQFEDDAFENGDSSQLAARGLYGDYALFFPAQVLSRRQASGEVTSGLDLTKVDDILLRFDYVTVAR